MAQRLRVHQQNQIACVQLLGAETFPRLSQALLTELETTLARFQQDFTCLGLVIQGSVRAFAAGAEITEVSALSSPAALAFTLGAQALFTRMENFPKPIVAAINGYCLGGGMDLALACWRRIATPDAIFAHPGVTLGLMTGWGGTQRLARLVGRPRALELLLTAKRINASEAHKIGLVDKIVPAEVLVATAVSEARALASALESRMGTAISDLTGAG